MLGDGLGDYYFTPDSYYFSYQRSPGNRVLVDLSSKKVMKETELSSDGKLCAVCHVSKTFIGKSQDDQRNAVTIQITVIDLQTHTTVATFEAEDIPANSYVNLSTLVFSSDNSVLKVNLRFSYRVNHELKHFSRDLQFDLSFLKNQEIQNAMHNKLTPQQSMLLLLLDEVKNKNKNKEPISLLHDIALKQMLSLKELQATLASFHPLIAQSIIEWYGIIDPTPEAIEKAKQKKAEQNRWTSMVKLSSFAVLLGALTCWYFK